MVRKRTAKGPTVLRDHIRELIRRIIVVVAVGIIASSVAYNYQKEIIDWLLAPLGGQKLMYLTPGGGFHFIFQVTMDVGIACAIPVAVYNLFRFISPTLPRKVRNLSVSMSLASLGLMISGTLFGYYIAIPGAMRFLGTIASEYINTSLTADAYLGFVLAYTIGLSVLFQLPLIFLLIHWIKPLKPSKLLKGERWAVLGSVIVAAIVTPTPDLMNQMLFAAPLIVMYQVGLILICISVYRAKRRDKKAQKAALKAAKSATIVTPPASQRGKRGEFVKYRQQKRAQLQPGATITVAAPVAPDTLAMSSEPEVPSLPSIDSSSTAVAAHIVSPPALPTVTPAKRTYMDFAPSKYVVPRHHERATPLAGYAEQRARMAVAAPVRGGMLKSSTTTFAIDGITPRRVVSQ